MKSRGRVALIGLGILAAAPAAWWILSTLDKGYQGADPDYAWRPPELSSATKHAIGITSLAIVVGAAVTLMQHRREHGGSVREMRVIAALTGATAFVGAFYATATMPGVGANIGYGLMAMLGIGLIPVLLGVAAFNGRRMHQERTATQSSTSASGNA